MMWSHHPIHLTAQWHQTPAGIVPITFAVELVIPLDAPEAVVDLQSEGVVDLGTIPDVIGLTGRQPGAAGCRALQGRDARSVRVLVPDLRGLEQNFHDVTIVDMGDLPEPSVSYPSVNYPTTRMSTAQT